MQTTLPAKHIIDYADVVVLSGSIHCEISDRFKVCPGTTVQEWLEESGYDIEIRKTPHLVVLNAVPLLEKQFTTKLSAGDVLSIVAQPGIGWLAVLGWSFVVATSAYSLYLAFTQQPTDIDSQGDRSSTYNISYRGNRAKPGAPVPVVYGTIRTYPDLSSNSYTQFNADGEQILYQLFEFTQGQADITDMRYEDTLLSAFDDIDIEILQPGQKSKLFPHSVNNVGAVSDIELSTDWSTAYAICDPTENAAAFYVDIATPEGMYQRNFKGSYYPVYVNIEVQWRKAGTSDSWFQKSFDILDSEDPKTFTFKVNIVEDGYYEVRVRRRYASPDDATVYDKAVWVGLKSFIPTDIDSTTTRVAVRVRASDQLGSQSLSQFSGVVKRKLPIYNGSTWSSPQLTNSPVWAFCDVLRAEYGANRPDSYIDLAQMVYLYGRDGEQAEFNAVYDTKKAVWDVLNEVAFAMLARAIRLNGEIYTIVEDLEAQPRTALFTMRNIVKDSFSIEHVGVVDESFDSVNVTFFDKNQDYREVTMKCVPTGITSTRTKDITVRGATNGLHAAILGLKLANENIYRRQMVSFTTGIEGRLIKFGSVIGVSHYLFGIQQNDDSVSGDIISIRGNVLTVAEDVSKFVGQGTVKIFFRMSDGSSQGPIDCVATGFRTINVTGSWDKSFLTFPDYMERPKFAIGPVATFIADIKVTKIEEVNDHEIRIEGFVDNQNAYNFADPPTPPILADVTSNLPTITRLKAAVSGIAGAPTVRLSWTWANCDYAIVEQSTDSGATWAVLSRSFRDYFIVTGAPVTASLQYRVTGVNIGKGVPQTVVVNSAAYSPSIPNVTGLVALEPFVGRCYIQWNAVPANHRTKLEVVWNGAVKRTEYLERDVTRYDYNWFDSIADQATTYYGELASVNGARDVTFRLYAIDDDNNQSVTPATISLSNAQVGALAEVQTRELGGGDLRITYRPPDARDFYGVEVHLSKTNGFTPSASTLVYYGRDASITLTDVLDHPDTYYMKMAGMDLWGRDGMAWNSATINTADKIADGEVTTPKLGDNVVNDDKVDTSSVFMTDYVIQAASSGWEPYEIPSGQSNQEATWRTFAEFAYDMSGKQPSQELILLNVKTKSLKLKFDTSASIYIDLRILGNASEVIDYYYAADYLLGATPSAITAGQEYELTNLFGGLPRVNSNHNGRLEYGPAQISNPIVGENIIRCQIRVIRAGFSALSGDIQYGESYAVMTGGRA